MKYVALKECGFDKRYYPGDLIDASVIDASVVDRAITYGKIRPLEEGTVSADTPAGKELAGADQQNGEVGVHSESGKRKPRGKGDA